MDRSKPLAITGLQVGRGAGMVAGMGFTKDEYSDDPQVLLAQVKHALKIGAQRSAFRSLRAMRRLLERVTIECYEGLRPMKDLGPMAASMKTCAELFVAEKQLSAAGLDLEEAEHVLGDDGGLSGDLQPRGYRHVTRSLEKGTSARGTPVDKYKVVEEGGDQQKSLADDIAEIEEDF